MSESKERDTCEVNEALGAFCSTVFVLLVCCRCCFFFLVKNYLQTTLIAISVADATANYIQC